jgi:hypothetical protein
MIQIKLANLSYILSSICMFVCLSDYQFFTSACLPVWLSVRPIALPVCLSICLSLSVCLSVCLFVSPSVCPSFFLSVHLSVRPSVCLFDFLSVYFFCLSVYLYICLFVCLFFRPAVCPSVRLIICRFILSVCLSVKPCISSTTFCFKFALKKQTNISLQCKR